MKKIEEALEKERNRIIDEVRKLKIKDTELVYNLLMVILNERGKN